MKMVGLTVCFPPGTSTTQMAVIVADGPAALINIVQARIPPATIALLAAGVNAVAVLPDVATGVSVRAISIAILTIVVAPLIAISVAVPISITVLTIAVIVPVPVAVATQVSIVVDDLAAAALDVVELRVAPVAVEVLARCVERGAVHTNVTARLLIRTPWRLRRCCRYTDCDEQRKHSA